MSIAQRLVNLSDGLSAEGILSAAKGGTGTTTGAGSSTPTISAINYGGDDTATNPAGGATITLTGTNFASGARVLINTTPVSVVTVVSATQITFTAPALAAGSYILYVVNLDGSTAIAVPGIQYSGTPAWTTAAGSLGTGYETAAVSTTVSATSDSAVSYSVVGGTLPSGVTINAGGTISGTSPIVGGSTTYTFTVRATDAELQDTDRQFSLTINPDVVTWSSSNTVAIQQNASSTTTLAATSAAGQTVSYSVDTLPAGLTLSGAVVSGTATSAGTTTTTATATAAVTGKTAQQTITWTVSIAADTYFPYTTLLLNGENTATPFLADASTNNFSLTAVGDTKPNNFGPYTPGYYSNYFDGSGDSFSIAAGNSALSLGTNNFTVEFWVCPVVFGSNSNSAPTMVAVHDGATDSGWQLFWNDGRIGIRTHYSNVMGWDSGMTSYLNKWSHIAYVRSSGTQKIYVDGIERCSTSTVWNWTDTQLQVATAAQDFNGYISNLRILKGTALYTAAFTPPTQPLTAVANTSLLTCQSNRFVDNSVNNFTIIPRSGGNQKISSFDPFVPDASYATYGSTYFDGTGDYVRVPASSNLSFSTDFTIECWVNTSTTSLDPYGRRLWSFGDGAAFYLDAPFYNGSSITPNMCIQIASIGIVITGTRPVADGQWHHVALTRAGSSMRLFVDGIQSGSTYTNSSAFTAGATNGMFIGCLGAGVGGFLQGNVSNFRVVNGTAVYTADFTPPATPLTAVTNTSLLTLQTNQPVNNQTFLDNSTSALPITRNGNATQGSFSPYGANWSNYFDGSGDYLQYQGSETTTLSGNFTIEAWVNVVNFSSGRAIICIGDAYAAPGAMFYISNAAKLSFTVPSLVYTSSGTVPTNTWTHIALVRNSGVITGYINGVAQGTASNSSTISGTNSYIGQEIYNGGLGGVVMYGHMSNLRLVKGTAVYTANFTPPTAPLTPIAGTSLLTCQSPSLIDSSINAFALTRNGDTRVEKFSPFATVMQTPTTHSIYFDGTGDYIVSPAAVTNQLTGDFTVECWFNMTGYVNGMGGLIGMGGTTSSNSTGVTIYPETNGKLAFKVTDTLGIVYSTTVITTGVWYHVALVRSGTTNTLYLNGVAEASNTATPTWTATPTISIGKAWLESAYTNFNGYISNVRIVKGTAIYTANFTPSTQPLTAVAGTYLLTCQDAVIRDNSTTQLTLTTYGDTKPVRQNPFGYTTSSAQDYTPSVFGSSAYFDGSGDYLTIPDSAVTEPGSNNFTLECWYYMNAGSGYLIGKRNPASANYGIFQISVYPTGGAILGVLEGGSPWNLSLYFTATTPLYTWNHLAFVRSGNVYTVYINGVSSGTTTLAGALNNSNYDWVVGAYQSDGTGAFNGYISDMRLVNGTALYTSNFVPPSAPLTAVQNTTLLLNMDRAAVQDKSGKTVMETIGDAKVSTSVRKYGTSSLYFDGTGDYLTFPSNPQYAFGTGDFTIECWVNSADVSPSQRGFLQTSATAGGFQTTYTSGITFLFGAGASGGSAVSLNGGVVSNIAGTYVGSSTAVITANTWTHLALVRSNGTATMYVNGVSVGSATATGNCTGTNLVVGGYYSTGYVYGGYIDDLRITRGYARYTANFTPPQQALLTK